MRIKQGLVKVVFGENGNTSYRWFRISRAKLDKLSMRISSMPNFYYAKVYNYERLGKRKGNVKEQIAYIYWDKDGILTAKTM